MKDESVKNVLYGGRLRAHDRPHLTEWRTGRFLGFKHKILVVDSEAIVRLSIELILEHLGCLVDTAATGDEALVKIQSVDFDLVLTEIQGIGMAGERLMRRLNMIKPWLPVVVLTSALVGSNPGMAGVLAKPCSLEEIQGVLSKISKRSILDALARG